MVKWLGWLAVILAIGAVVAAIAVVGSPREVRARKADQQRVTDLTNIRSEIQNYFNEKKELPESLDKVDFSVYENSRRTSPRDPVSHEPYKFERTGDRKYRLGAMFQLESRKPVNEFEPDGQLPFSRHDKGEQWFDLEVKNLPK